MLVKIRRHISRKTAQSSLEYITLFAVIVAAIIIGQAFMKRKAQGYFKEQGDQLSSEGWSFSNSTEHYKEALTENRTIYDQVNTNGTAIVAHDRTWDSLQDLEGKNIHSQSESVGGTTRIQRRTTTDALTQEDYKFSDYDKTQFGNFTMETDWDSWQ